jgi:nucleoid-associated protein YgaU
MRNGYFNIYNITPDKIKETLDKIKRPILEKTVNKKSTGGPLYPFSFQKNPYWKTPVVRYEEGGQTYTVKSGDTLSGIAKSYGVSI